MDRSNVIYLVKDVRVKDDLGIFRQTEQHRRVFAQVDSITRAEFDVAGRQGLNPDFKFTIFAGDYEGEKTLLFGRHAYGIYRTYLARNDNLELFAERKGGATGGSSD